MLGNFAMLTSLYIYNADLSRFDVLSVPCVEHEMFFFFLDRECQLISLLHDANVLNVEFEFNAMFYLFDYHTKKYLYTSITVNVKMYCISAIGCQMVHS